MATRLSLGHRQLHFDSLHLVEGVLVCSHRRVTPRCHLRCVIVGHSRERRQLSLGVNRLAHVVRAIAVHRLLAGRKLVHIPATDRLTAWLLESMVQLLHFDNLLLSPSVDLLCDTLGPEVKNFVPPVLLDNVRLIKILQCLLGDVVCETLLKIIVIDDSIDSLRIICVGA